MPGHTAGLVSGVWKTSRVGTEVLVLRFCLFLYLTVHIDAMCVCMCLFACLSVCFSFLVDIDLMYELCMYVVFCLTHPANWKLFPHPVNVICCAELKEQNLKSCDSQVTLLTTSTLGEGHTKRGDTSAGVFNNSLLF